MSQSNLPSTHRWYAEDYQQATPDFKRFLGQLNLFSEPIYNILNGGISITDNTLEELYTLTINPASATATANATTFVPKKFVGAPNGIVIGQCLFNASTGVAAAVGNPVTFDWVWTGSVVSILAIYGLTASASYTLKLRIY